MRGGTQRVGGMGVHGDDAQREADLEGVVRGEGDDGLHGTLLPLRAGLQVLAGKRGKLAAEVGVGGAVFGVGGGGCWGIEGHEAGLVLAE